MIVKEDCMRTALKMLLLSVLVVAAAIGFLTGCTDKTENISTSVTGPNASILVPTGTLQGVLVDRVTNKPIVGAIVDIGVTQATTNSTGGFVLSNVPATTDPAGTGGVSGNYIVTIDLRNVSSPVNMADPAATPRYPEFSYADAQVSYSTLNDTDNGGGANATNHDTPVNGLVASLPLQVGKLSTTISGVVAYDGSKQVASDQTWYVLLVSTNSAPFCDSPACYGSDSSVGVNQNVISKLTVTSGGASSFSFANVEARAKMHIIAYNAAQTYYGSQEFQAPGDGETKVLVIQHDDATLDNSTVFVKQVDALAPVIITVSPEDKSDITPGATNVVFTFSEPILKNAYTEGLTVSAASGIHKDVTVNYNGVKASNIAHTLAWNTAYTTLTVGLPSVAGSSKYTVDISAVQITDVNKNAVTNLAAKGVINFTTNGGANAQAPLSVVDLLAPQDWNAGVNLDWLASSGAKKYNVYKRTVQWPGVTAYEQVGQWKLLHTAATTTACYTTANTDFSDSEGLVEGGNIQLRADYKVHGVNSDCVESAASYTVQVLDAVAPTQTAQSSTGFPTMMSNNTNIRLFFSEPLQEGLAETTANYAMQLNTISGASTTPSTNVAVYGVIDNNANSLVDAGDTFYVDLTFSASIDPASLKQTTVSAGPNGICESAKAVGDVWATNRTSIISGGTATYTPYATMGVGKGVGYSVCVTSDGTGVLEATNPTLLCDANGNGTVAAAESGCDDAIFDVGVVGTPHMAILSGPDGICNTAKRTVASIDIQSPTISIGGGVPNALCISAGSDMMFTTTIPLTGDDVLTRNPLIKVNGIKDVAGNTITQSTINTDGTVQ